jgi:hypothetical protein
MATIAGVCASQPLPNPGMAAVDMAFYRLAQRMAPTATFKVFRLFSPEERNPEMHEARRGRFSLQARMPFSYEPLRGRLDHLCGGDLIVYWGDFLHSREYVTQVAALLEKIGVVGTMEAAERVVYEHLFLAGEAEPILRKTLLFGGTLLFNSERDYLDAGYGSQLRRLLSRAGGVWMRDVYSALRVAREFGTLPQLTLGLDCSLLLRKADLTAFPRSGTFDRAPLAVGAAGIFFGRSTVAGVLGRFAQELFDVLGATAEWLPWFDESLMKVGFCEIQDAFPGLQLPPGPSPMAGDLLERLTRYRFVLSDTYHVCLNAWNFGIPAICVGSAFPDECYDVSAGWYGAWRDKRQVFFAMHDAMEFYVMVEELFDDARRAKRVHLAAEVLRDEALVQRIHTGIREQALRTEADFVGVASRLLTREG